MVASGSGGSSGGGMGTGAGGHGATSGGTGSGGSFDDDGGMQCGLVSFDLVRKPADLFLLLDRSASMQEDNAGDKVLPAGVPSKWAQVVPAVTMAVAQTDKDVSWGLKTFPEGTDSECSATTLTTQIDVQIAAMNATAVNAAVNATMPLGNGTPTASAVNIAFNYLKNLNDGANKYILLATDGSPSCTAAMVHDTTQAHPDAVAAVTAAAAGGVKTFVVGVATTSKTDAMTLNDMAVAGGEAQANPNPLATKFYLSESQADLVNAIKAIAGQISTCTFPLSSPPPVPEHIAVKVSGVKAPQDTMHLNGWDYTDGTFTAVQVYGSWCDMIKSSANMVTIIFGCKDIIPT
jgi:hypothetical protein